MRWAVPLTRTPGSPSMTLTLISLGCPMSTPWMIVKLAVLADHAELSQVAAECRRTGAGGGIFDHSAASEWVAGVIALL